MDVLAEEFARDPDWSKERLLALSRLTGLTEAQIYKWGWDQRRKAEAPPALNEAAELAPP